MKKIILLFSMLLLTGSIMAQTYTSKNAYARFFSTTPMENIEAINNQVNAAINTETGEVFFRVLIKSFKFEKALMQEHFNENYLESGKFPNAEFSGKITNLGDIDFKTDGEYAVTVKGKMTIHGVSREITEKGTIIVKDGKIQAKAVFQVKPDDYDIAIPGAVRNKIAETIEVSIDATLAPKK